MENLQITLTGKVYKAGLRYLIKKTAKRCGIFDPFHYQDEMTLLIHAFGVKQTWTGLYAAVGWVARGQIFNMY